jgi:hypothetical protein
MLRQEQSMAKAQPKTNRMKFIVQFSLSGHDSNNGEENRQ